MIPIVVENLIKQKLNSDFLTLNSRDCKFEIFPIKVSFDICLKLHAVFLYSMILDLKSNMKMIC